MEKSTRHLYEKKKTGRKRTIEAAMLAERKKNGNINKHWGFWSHLLILAGM